MSSRDEREAREHFEERYSLRGSHVAKQVEHRVIGATWGANGYTTLAQADELARLLQLHPGARVLDVGTGRGWPGVYYAVRYGCDVVGTDLPIAAVAIAARHAAREGLEDRFAAVVAAGAHQPFRSASFDAIVHTDVLC